jgi:hypothetical protein
MGYDDVEDILTDFPRQAGNAPGWADAGEALAGGFAQIICGRFFEIAGTTFR